MGTVGAAIVSGHSIDSTLRAIIRDELSKLSLPDVTPRLAYSPSEFAKAWDISTSKVYALMKSEI